MIGFVQLGGQAFGSSCVALCVLGLVFSKGLCLSVMAELRTC